MNEPVTNIITTCMNVGVIVSINQRIEKEIIELVAEEFGFELKYMEADEIKEDEEEEILDNEADFSPQRSYCNRYGACRPWKNIPSRLYP